MKQESVPTTKVEVTEQEPSLDAVIKVAQRAVVPTMVYAQASPPSLLVFPPDDKGDIRVLDVTGRIAPHRSAPARAVGLVALNTVTSLIAYVKRHSTEGTDIWVHPDSGEVVAVLNNHDPDPGWGDHRARLKLIQTDEWGFWANANGKLMPQADFANHIEEGQKDILDPDPATMLEIASTLQAQIGADFASGIRLTDGQVQLKYIEQMTSTVGKQGDLKIPATFTIGIAPFQGESPFRVTARLRYRLNSGRLAIGYILDRPADVIRACLDHVAETLHEEFDNVYIGTPRP